MVRSLVVIRLYDKEQERNVYSFHCGLVSMDFLCASIICLKGEDVR